VIVASATVLVLVGPSTRSKSRELGKCSEKLRLVARGKGRGGAHRRGGAARGRDGLRAVAGALDGNVSKAARGTGGDRMSPHEPINKRGIDVSAS
jgi:hypothetical protein